ncbi:dephospho-CoA kinase [Undibacterium luofuense]|uniref:Dephospho-CoA kinase n=1 Tax=Undibacterium luofuense TaxID=2828733 RepID=A0A941DKC7_9BURK|nr:dephospho-CoA kinase [Undibacterium luofuense]MBR7782413.1 dephospho-CoA kinase [Undibacterium luofuense]
MTRFAVGLTGGIGSGKTTIANWFADQGATLIDTDLIAHSLTRPGGLAMDAVRQQFGSAFVDADGAMDRAKMRELVFQRPEARQQLQAILHPLIRSECEREALTATGAYVIFVVPLLVESGGWRERVNRILVVDCPETLQQQRVMQRNGFSREQIEAIMATQARRTERLAVADDVVVNDVPLTENLPLLTKLHQHYLALSQTNV